MENHWTMKHLYWCLGNQSSTDGQNRQPLYFCYVFKIYKKQYKFYNIMMQNNYNDNSQTLVVLTQTVCYTSTCTMFAKVWVTEIQLFQKISRFISTLFLSWSIIQEFVFHTTRQRYMYIFENVCFVFIFQIVIRSVYMYFNKSICVIVVIMCCIFYSDIFLLSV
jgi:hypothetical protein